MREYLDKLPKETRNLISLAREIASKNNMPAYLVGGFVRDLILGAKNLDLDIVVEGDGIKFAEDYARKLKAKVIRHSRFGTATIILGSRLKVDIATARKEIYPQPAQLPQVSRGVLKDDLFRRDFTINAMAMSVSSEGFGRLIDLFDGKEDLRQKKIRILHNLSFIDDPTRMLRAIRFEKRYNFKIEPETLKLLKEAVRLKMLEKVGPHRLRDELILILKEEKPLKYIRRIKELTGLNFINPHLSVSEKTEQLLISIDKQNIWFKINYSSRRPLDTWLIYLMGLTDCLNRNEIKSMCNKFSFCQGDVKRILSYRNINPKFIGELSRSNIKPSKIFELLEPLSYEAILLIKAKQRNPVIQRHVADFFEIYNGIRICVSGHDLQRLGVLPGPYYQKVFARVLKAKLEGKIRTKKEELAFIGRLIKNR